MAGKNFDAMIDAYRGSVPRSIVLGLISEESHFNPGAVNADPNVPGGGPKTGMMQPTQAALRAIGGTTVNLTNPADNIKIGCSILNLYLRELRREFPGAFDRSLDDDANAAAVLLHAWNGTLDDTLRMLRGARALTYREIERANSAEPVIASRYADRVLTAARQHGYTQILPAGGAAVKDDARKSGGALPWLLGAAAVGAGVFLLSKRRR